MKIIWVQIHDIKQLSKEQTIKGLGYYVYGASKLQKKSHYDIWNNSALNHTMPDWEQLLGKYNALVVPLNITYFKSIFETFPDAKVIIDDINPDNYVIRFKKFHHLVKVLSILRFNTQINRIYSVVMKGFFIFYKGDYSNKNIKKTYLELKKEVLEIVPKDNLLLVKEDAGWIDFTTFLNVSTPSFPYPLYTSNNLNIQRTGRALLASFLKHWPIYTLYIGTLIGLMIYLIFFYH